MEHFESTEALMKLLKSGEYKRLVMENKESTLDSEEDFDAVFEDYKAFTSDPANYDYFTRRQLKQQDA
jgi:hypothetical protein